MQGIINPEKLFSMPTPIWYYDMSLFRRTVDAAVLAAQANGIIIHYSIKANSEPRLLSYMKGKGLGVDCVSGNEVKYAIEQGFDPDKVVFAGVGKSDEEILFAMRAGIGSFNCESIEELAVIEELAAAHGLRANVSLRINPEVDAKTHKFMTTGLEMDKFGIPKKDLAHVVEILTRSSHINFKGLHFHIGSQITDVENVFTNECISANGIVSFFEENGFPVENIDLGGGLGIDYYNPDSHDIPEFELWFGTIKERLKTRPGQKIHVEPGRALVAQCVSLLSKVIFVKEGESKTFVILDTGMNDLIRPALYHAYHKIENLTASSERLMVYDVAGPICESADVLAVDRILPVTKRGDILAIRSVGAYGAVMSSRYNMRDPARIVFSDDL